MAAKRRRSRSSVSIRPQPAFITVLAVPTQLHSPAFDRAQEPGARCSPHDTPFLYGPHFSLPPPFSYRTSRFL